MAHLILRSGSHRQLQGSGLHVRSCTFHPEDTPNYHCMRAYNDLHQHQGCIKTSIKMGSHLMLF